MNDLKTIIKDINTMSWEERYNPRVGRASYRKMLIKDPETGMHVHLRHYPAGFVTPWHTHTCSHGMYVLKGTLKTNEGNYGPGTFVWHPEGIIAEHGASDEEDVYVLFITNKKFDIHYIEKL